MYKISNKYRLTAILTALALSSTFSFAGVTPVYATELEDTITDLKTQQKETQDAMERLKEQQENAQDNVDELSDQSKDLQNIYADYASQMSTINSEITKVQESLQETYDAMYAAYSKIFSRMGLDFRAVQADTGSIGEGFL